uniref:ethanolamine-phosphate cytidylyltransferase n=1 Tax=Anopheles darlingi TaxID=43151 RepID=A0A2M4CSN2_ANODA
MENQNENGHHQQQQQTIGDGKKVRVWCDGCYDMVHFGHANSLRQAKALGHKLIVGIHNDADITRNRGLRVFLFWFCFSLVLCLSFVYYVLSVSFFFPSLVTVVQLVCGFCVLVDDFSLLWFFVYPCLLVPAVFRFTFFSLASCVSLAVLVGLLLLFTENFFSPGSSQLGQDHTARSPWTGCSQFLPTTQKIIQFSDGKPPKPTDRIVYVAGAFDLFHVGHLDFLEKARSYGDYLIVGLHTDPVVNEYKGGNYPIMNLHERVLSVLACKYVNEVVIGAPYSVTADLMEHFNVGLVCHGQTHIALDVGNIDPYAIPKQMGKFMLIDSGNTITTEDIVDRIIRHRLEFETRNQKKEKKEIEVYEAMQKVKLAQKSG